MIFLNVGSLIISFDCLILITGQLHQPMTWEKASEHCKAEGKIISPNSSPYKNVVVFHRERTMWTSNYILHLGCINNTDYCPGAYVEQVPVDKPQKGLCYQKNQTLRREESRKVKTDTQKTFDDACVMSEGSHELISIVTMADLHDIPKQMTHSTKYWIKDINDLFHTRIVRYCEVYNKFKNTSNQNHSKILRSDCDAEFTFSCVSGKEYHIVISLINIDHKTPDIRDIPVWKTNQMDRETNNDTSYHNESWEGFFQSPFFQFITVETSIVLMLIVLILISCLNRRWMKKMKNDLMESLRKKFDHQMYDSENAHAKIEDEANTTISSRESSRYNYAYSSYNGDDLNRISSQIDSQTAAKQIQQQVAGWDKNTYLRPKQALPENKPPSGNDGIHRSPGMRRPGLKTKESYVDCKSPRRKDSITSPKPDICLTGTGGGSETCVSCKQLEMESLERKTKPSPKPLTKFSASLSKASYLEEKVKDSLVYDVQDEAPDDMYMNTAELKFSN